MKKLIAVIGITTVVLSLVTFFNEPKRFDREKYIASVCLEMAAEAEQIAAIDAGAAAIIRENAKLIKQGKLIPLTSQVRDTILPDIYLKQGVSR